jgi:predicted nucleic acid-binding protein
MTSVKYIIQAAVVDINTDKPKNDDVFLIDSNVWYWLTYTHASQGLSPPCPYQVDSYPNYVKMALELKALIYASNLSLAELTHLIEKTQREIYNHLNRTKMTPKMYRHNLPEERSVVVSEVEAAWGQVTSLARPLAGNIDENVARQGLLRFQREKVDGYDLFMLESMSKGGITQIITDDGDFSSVSGITVFTANQGVLAAAKEQDKLVERSEREPSLIRS